MNNASKLRASAASLHGSIGRARYVWTAAAIFGLAVLALSSCQRASEPVAPEIRPVRVIRIDQRAGADTITLTGTVQAQTEINQSFRIEGRLIERSVNVGDTVRPGQVIARLDPQNEETGLLSARAQLAAARAQQVEAQHTFGRMRDLVAEDAVSRASFDQSEALMHTADSAVESAQSQVTLAGNRLTYTRLVSDVAGVVTAVGAESGEVVGAGRMIVEVAKEGGRDAVFDFPAAVKESMPAEPDITVVLTINPKVMAAGRVREIAPRADPMTGTFRVRVRLVDPPPAMRLGSTVTGRMKRDSIQGYVVPASALVRSERQPAVWIVDPKTSKVAMHTVDVKEFDPGRVVVASGLKPGDIVVTAGVQALRPDQKVRLLESKP
ncbi:MAG TPA: efflux RND transporter periplasmic adaptor subunit [Casimicrobiaceae bacterium]|jgi:RND family efflux transporter MFP subunit